MTKATQLISKKVLRMTVATSFNMESTGASGRGTGRLGFSSTSFSVVGGNSVVELSTTPRT